MIVRPVFDIIYILRLPHGRKEIMLHHDLLKRYVPREQSLVPLDTSGHDISLGGDVKEHGIHDLKIELESEEEDSQDKIPKGPQDLVESEKEDSQDEIPRWPQDLERRQYSFKLPGLRRST